jgi:hypothetical protein
VLQALGTIRFGFLQKKSNKKFHACVPLTYFYSVQYWYPPHPPFIFCTEFIDTFIDTLTISSYSVQKITCVIPLLSTIHYNKVILPDSQLFPNTQHNSIFHSTKPTNWLSLKLYCSTKSLRKFGTHSLVPSLVFLQDSTYTLISNTHPTLNSHANCMHAAQNFSTTCLTMKCRLLTETRWKLFRESW